MAITNNALDKNKILLYGLTELKLIPYAGDALGTKSFTFDTLLADSVSLQQDENTINQRDCETKSEPAIKNVVLGSWQFAATSLDLRGEILANFGGWVAGSTDTDVYLAPSAYKTLYAMAIMKFGSSDMCVVCPKIQIDARAVLASLKTSSSECAISGTAVEGELTVDSGKKKATVAFVPAGKLETVIPELAGE